MAEAARQARGAGISPAPRSNPAFAATSLLRLHDEHRTFGADRVTTQGRALQDRGLLARRESGHLEEADEVLPPIAVHVQPDAGQLAIHKFHGRASESQRVQVHGRRVEEQGPAHEGQRYEGRWYPLVVDEELLVRERVSDLE